MTYLGPRGLLPAPVRVTAPPVNAAAPAARRPLRTALWNIFGGVLRLTGSGLVRNESALLLLKGPGAILAYDQK
jgi:hypothetical protein